MDDEVEGWIYNTRLDGMRVVKSHALVWIVIPKDGRASITSCPCCNKTFATPRAAKLVANAVYPPGSAAGRPFASE